MSDHISVRVNVLNSRSQLSKLTTSVHALHGFICMGLSGNSQVLASTHHISCHEALWVFLVAPISQGLWEWSASCVWFVRQRSCDHRQSSYIHFVSPQSLCVWETSCMSAQGFLIVLIHFVDWKTQSCHFKLSKSWEFCRYWWKAMHEYFFDTTTSWQHPTWVIVMGFAHVCSSLINSLKPNPKQYYSQHILSARWHRSKNCKFLKNQIHFTVKPVSICTLLIVLTIESRGFNWKRVKWWFLSLSGGFFRPPPTSVHVATVKPRPYGHDPFWSVFEEHRLHSTTTDITTALFIL